MTSYLTDNSYGIIPVMYDGLDPQVLIVQHLAGHWGFPKGHAEVGETPFQTAQRELHEETGLTTKRLVVETPLLHHYTFERSDGPVHKTVAYYVAEVDHRTVRVQPEEIRAYRWMNLNEARGLLPTNNNGVISALQRLFAT